MSDIVMSVAVASDLLLPNRLDYMWAWVKNREKARQAKEAGKPKPWVADPILQTTRFCNVCRKDDKVSKWLFEEWYVSSSFVGRGQQLANAGMARLINWPDTLEYLIDAKLNVKFNAAKATKVLQQVKAKHGKLFTGAYIINGIAGQDKIKTVVDQFQAMYKQPKLVDPTSMRETHTRLQTVKGNGSFIAGQIVADLRHVWPGEWADRDTWAPLGPGSRRGMAWMQGWDGIEPLPAMRQETFERLLTKLMKEFRKRVPKIMQDRALEAHDIQNCLCEYDKWMRLYHGTGRGKNKYAGAGA
jgi:hypothetical protein